MKIPFIMLRRTHERIVFDLILKQQIETSRLKRELQQAEMKDTPKDTKKK
jgi:hypothetical protein